MTREVNSWIKGSSVIEIIYFFDQSSTIDKSDSRPSGRRGIVEWDFFILVTFVIGLDSRQIPDSFLMVPDIRVAL